MWDLQNIRFYAWSASYRARTEETTYWKQAASVQQPLGPVSVFKPIPQRFSFPKGTLTAESKRRCATHNWNLLQHIRFRTMVFANGNTAWRAAAKSLKIPFESVSHQHKVFVKPGKKVDIGTQVIDRTWLEMKTWLGRKYPVSIRKNTRRIRDPTLDKLIYQFVFRQSVLPLKPQGFMSQLRRLLKPKIGKVKVRTDGPHWPCIPNVV